MYARTIAVAGLALILAGTAAFGADKDDVIVLTDGTVKKVTRIDEENYANVKFTSGGRQDSVKAADVKEITYGDAPQAFKNGLGLLNSKKYADAIKELLKAQKAAGVREWLKGYTLYFLGEASRRAGTTDPSAFESAVEYYDQLLKEVPFTRFLPQALYYKGECLMRMEKYSEANEVFNSLISEQARKGFDASWASMGQIAQAKVLEAQGHHDQAYHKYESIERMATDRDIKNMAKLRKGICLLAQKKYSEAKRYFQDLAESAEGESSAAREVRGGASVGLGHCFINENKYAEARHHFLKAMVIFFSSDDFNTEAMFHAGLCYEKLKSSEPGADFRAKLIFSDLIRRYPNSPWTKKAKEKGYKDLGEGN